MRATTKAALHAGGLGALGAWLTFAFTNPLGVDWTLKDIVFVVAVIVAVFYNRLSMFQYERLIQNEHCKKRQNVPPLQRIEWVHGTPVQIETNKVTVLLFFGSWCYRSRAALKELERLRNQFTHEAMQFVALTQEKREELEAYKVKGRNAIHFQELNTFPFSIAIEDGLMSKEYLVRYDIDRVPHMFVIGKTQTIVWYGKPAAPAIDTILRRESSADNAAQREVIAAPLPIASGEQDKDDSSSNIAAVTGRKAKAN